jgi:hypothetical protein
MKTATPSDILIVEEWIARLKSGDYKQGCGSLCTETKNGLKHCCIGVLCDVAIDKGHPLNKKIGKDIEVRNACPASYHYWDVGNDTWPRASDATYMPASLIQLLGRVFGPDGIDALQLMTWNDKTRRPFAMIAQYLEARLALVKKKGHLSKEERMQCDRDTTAKLNKLAKKEKK